ncbi:hypothetical protein CGL57_09870 [Edwardsiella anguillarum]|nr:hypothetical protein CGL57_09870 [Edwardsiella anguillarum]
MNILTKASADFTMFKFGDKEIRVLSKNGEPWFVASDVCSALGLSNSRVSLLALDDDEKGVSSTYTLKGNQEVAIVSESGMYTLALRCRDAVNKGSIPHAFRKWVTAEVLPSIRKVGKYEVTSSHQNPPVFRYIVTLSYRDVVTGQEETIKGGCNTPEEIIRGTAKKFGIFVSDMREMPVNAFY